MGSTTRVREQRSGSDRRRRELEAATDRLAQVCLGVSCGERAVLVLGGPGGVGQCQACGREFPVEVLRRRAAAVEFARRSHTRLVFDVEAAGA